MIIKLKRASGAERSQVESCSLSFLAYLNIIAICLANKAACLVSSVLRLLALPLSRVLSEAGTYIESNQSNFCPERA